MSLFLHRPLPLRPTTCRALSTTLPRPSSLQLEKNDLSVLADTVPPYPYGPAQWYKQSDRGLYGGQRIQFGNNIGPKMQTKTRRTWYPNVFRKRLFSRALDRYVQIKVTTRVMRTIDKLGGLDEYLLGEKEARVRELGVSGWWLRWAIMQTPEVRRRFVEERRLLGLPVEGMEAVIEEPEVAEGREVQVAMKEQEVVGEEAVQQRRLKFRVGPRAHLYYAPDGWHRASPDKELAYKRHVRLHDPKYKNFHQDQTAIALAALDQMSKTQSLSSKEMVALRQRLRSEVDKSAEKIVEAAWQARCAKLTKKRRLVREAVRVKTRAATRAELRASKRRERKDEGLVRDARRA